MKIEGGAGAGEVRPRGRSNGTRRKARMVIVLAIVTRNGVRGYEGDEGDEADVGEGGGALETCYLAAAL